ncbi:potassium/proton antiporter [Ilyobacter sp.]|uniref:potassium/proton antiporter n=1 Tax=Ilyobacter sp. TaxID=3100343 RepID=UPI0035616384
MTIEKVCIILAILIFFSIYSLKLSKKFNIPTLIIYLAVGMIAGSEGLGGIEFDNAKLAQFMGNLALCIILFSGAYNTDIKEISPVKKEGLALAFVGVLLNTILVAVPIYFFTPFDYTEALLFGAIVSSTDASAVVAILSFGGLDIKEKVGGILKLESGTNDPMANVIIILLITIIKSGQISITQGLLFLFLQIGVGALVGVIVAKLAIIFLERFEIKMQELHQIIILGFILFTYGVTNISGGNGFMAIYLLGLILGNSQLTYRRNMSRFFGSISWMVEVGLFVMLGLLVFPSKFLEIWKIGVAVSLILIFLARPLSVFITLFKSGLGNREKLFISWGGLKGAVPIVFATFPLVEGVANAELIFNLVFFVVLLSVIFQGMTLPFASRYLDLNETKDKILERGDLENLEYFEENLIKVKTRRDGIIPGKKIMDLHFPKDILLILINRKGKKILPRGDTLIEAEDELYILADDPRIVEEYIMDSIKKISRENRD